MKRLIDIAAASVALVALAPVFGLMALAVAVESGLPVFFGQTRVGRGFRRFRMWKFRSMVVNYGGSGITVAGDARVTRVGRILRGTKLDELPQFWNVLRGEMSLVGPRPELPEYVEIFRERYQKILSVRPGITDLASVRFRHEERLLAQAADPMEEYLRRVLPAKLELAEEYVSRKSLALDVAILIQTVQATLRAD